MHRRPALAILAAFCLLAVAMPSGAATARPTALELTPGMAAVNLGRFIELLPDPQKNLSIEQVCAPPLAGAFRPVDANKLTLPMDVEYFWLRLRARAAVGQGREAGWVLYTDDLYMKELWLHLPPGPDGKRPVIASGGFCQPFAQRQMAGRYPAFMVPWPAAGQEQELYLRVRTLAVVPVAFFAASLEAHCARALADDYIFGLCFGVMLTMIVYNLFLSASLRDKVYLLYVLYIFGMLAAGLFMYGQAQMLWDFASENYGRLLWFFMGWLTCAAYAFMRAFLGLRALAPKLDLVFRLCMAYGVAISLLGLASNYKAAWVLTTASGFFSSALAVAAGVIALRAGYQPARYYLAAWSVFALATFVFVLREVGLIDGGDLVRRSLLIGSALESMLLSLALADRIRRLRAEKDLLRHRAVMLSRLSRTDGLTGLFNKRHFDEQLVLQAGQAAASHAPLCLLMIDVDDFKAFNDSHGHPAGDQVLRTLASVIRASVRQADMPFRYGGEEFAVLLPGLDKARAGEVAQRILAGFAGQRFEVSQGQVAGCSVSIGLACLADDENHGSLLSRADQALYRAKRLGKNRLEAG